MKKNKLTNIIFLIIELIFIICMGFVTISNIINHNILFKNYNSILIIICLICYFIIIYILYKLTKKINLSINKIFLISIIIYLIAQFFVILLLKVNPSWDFGVVFNIVSDSLNNKASISSSIYLYQFQNNVIYAYILKLLLLPFKLFKITNYLIPAMIINAIVLDIGIIFIYKTIKLLFNEKIIKLFIILLFLFTPIILYVPIIYTDTIAFCFVAILLYLIIYLLSVEEKNVNYKTPIISITIGILLGIGTQVKFTIIILFIALLIIILFKNFKANMSSIILIFVSFLIITIGINLFINFKFDKNILNQNKVPITHWIMMGLSNYGNYNAKDYQITFEAGNYNYKVEFNKKEISERLKKHIDDNDLIQFYSNKTAYLWNDGSYYLPELLRLAQNKNIIHEFILPYGKYFNIFIYYLQIKHIFMIIILLLIPIISIKDQENIFIKVYLLISIIGYFCFFTIWEVSSRYLFHIIPLLLITYFYGVNIIIKKYTYIKQKELLKLKDNCQIVCVDTK